MYVVSVDFSENNLLAAQVGEPSLNNLNVFNSILSELQFRNFSDEDFAKIILSDVPVEGSENLGFLVLNEADFIKKIYTIEMENKSTPINNRKAKEFNIYYDMIWRDLDVHIQ